MKNAKRVKQTWKRLPPCPVSVRSHGDYRTWSAKNKLRFHLWALSLENYPVDRKEPYAKKKTR